MAESGISGKAVALATAGGVLMAAALTNRSPQDVIRSVMGKPTSGAFIGPDMAGITSNVRGISKFGQAAGEAAQRAAGSAAMGRAADLVTEARRHLGKPYRWGASGPAAFDCSGLVIYCLKAIGESGVPRFTTATFGAWAKARGAVRITPADFRAGDIILRTGHMGIAVSNTRMIHAPNVTTVVKESDIYSRSTWWGWRLTDSAAGSRGDSSARPEEAR